MSMRIKNLPTRSSGLLTGESWLPVESADITEKVSSRSLVEQVSDDFLDRYRGLVGSPLTASTASEMTDIDRVYIYTGSESGYTAGHWYYYDGSAWTDGGVYNSSAVQIDATLRQAEVAADAKSVGDALDSIVITATDENNDGNIVIGAVWGQVIE